MEVTFKDYGGSTIEWTGPCWCGNDDTTGGHRHDPKQLEPTPPSTTQMLTSLHTGCSNPSGRGHEWLNWLRVENDDGTLRFYWTRCVWCNREEQYDG